MHTSPISPVEQAISTSRTAPVELPSLDERVKIFAEPAAVETGTATNYWLELIAYPPGSARSLWLFVNNGWRNLDNPSNGIQDSVQEAFGNPDRFEVVVWYDGTLIVGLVVRKK